LTQSPGFLYRTSTMYDESSPHISYNAASFDIALILEKCVESY